jgi:hypothetical protein
MIRVGQVICGACWSMVNRRSSVKYFSMVSRPCGHARAEEFGEIGARPHLRRHDRGGDPDQARSGGREPFGCAPGQERITQVARSYKVALPYEVE